MTISLIVAMAQNHVIGLDGQMPWHLSADLKKFREMTTGHPIVMGRVTHEAIGRVLPNRTNVVVTHNKDYQAEGCLVFDDLQLALNHAATLDDEVFVIGGSTLYSVLLPVADRLYLTEIHRDFVGDTYFPAFNREEWQEIERIVIDDDPSVDFSYSFLMLKSTKNL